MLLGYSTHQGSLSILQTSCDSSQLMLELGIEGAKRIGQIASNANGFAKPSTSTETVAELAQRAKSMRLAQNLTQAGLEKRSGVSLGSIKLFERTGKISCESLIKIAIALGALEGFDGLFQPNLTEDRSIDDLLKDAKASTGRKRGRVR